MADLLQSIVIASPIDAVWHELTKLGARQRAMMDTILDSTLEVGEPLRYATPDGKRVFIVGRVLAVDPPRHFSHTFRLLLRDDPVTVVSWDLEELDDGTRVTLTHTGYPDDIADLHKVDKTWVGILAELKSVLESGDVTAKTKVTYAFMRAFMFALPSRTKVDNVAIPD